MTARLPLVVNSGFTQQLQAPTDTMDGADSLTALAGGRLTLTSATPVTITDTSGSTPTLYYTPYLHDRITLYTSGSVWTVYQFPELSAASLTGAAGSVADVFISWNSGSPGITTIAWTNSTTRATGLTLLNGVLVSSGNFTSRYVGTIFFDTTNTLSDTVLIRGIWNYNNRVTRGLLKTDSTSHTYGSATFREWNGGATHILQFVVGLLEDSAELELFGTMSIPATGATGFAMNMGIGVDSTTTQKFSIGSSNFGTTTGIRQFYGSGGFAISPAGLSTVGSHFIAALESGSTAGTQTSTFSTYTMTASLPM